MFLKPTDAQQRRRVSAILHDNSHTMILSVVHAVSFSFL